MSKSRRRRKAPKKESDQRELVGFWVAIISLITSIVNLLTALNK